ncbi:cytochrome b [Sphingomonas sp. SUN019]|uniref:cytochrome b n=1 Tax=Sphingomonas sp. SUN019 TaxID=2937788 RepID=UPI00216433EB|nr:cytochrome b [Sphingomonas sp. SUN019]UVO51054.1 cytochrome b [Sphingomonas sp. SUN019]
MGQDADTFGSIDQFADSTRAASHTARYSRTAMALHWGIAALVLSTIPLGWYGASFEGDTAQSATNLHKSIGIAILLLTSVRIGWRLTHTPPALPDGMAPALRRIAEATYVLFYVLLLILPFSGWWMSSAVPERHPFGFGPFDVPFLPVPRGFASAGPAHFVHINLAWVMVGLAALHILAALKHQFVDRDGVLARMLPISR